ALPERIRDVLLRRINMLEPTVMKIIGFASVIGTEFSIEVLKNVCEVGEEELITGLDSLVGARLIEEVQDKFATYRFTHLKTREVVYDDMSITKRRLFHKKVGLAIEELYKGRVEEVVHLLAWHFSLSKLPAKAIQYLVMAGDKAFKVYAWEVAIDSYSKAIAFAEESGELSRDEKIGLCMKLGESYELSGLYKEAQNYYLKSLELSKTGKECSYIHRKIGEMLEKDGKYDEALMHYETCIRELRLEEAKGEFGKTYACIGRIYSRKKEYPSATYYYLKAIEILGKIDTAMWDAADVCNSLGLIYWEMGNYKSALKYHEDSLNFRLKVSDLGDYYGLSASYVNLGNMFMNRMEYNDGIRCYETALELKKKIGEMEDIASTHDIIALSYKKIGQYERAKENFLTALDIRKKENDLTKIAISYANLGSIFYSMNDYDSALNFYNQCIELSKEIGVDVMATSNVAEICELLCLKKKFLEAKEYCKSGIAQIETRGFRENEFQIRLILGIVHRELGEFEESRENFEKCMKLGCEERDLGKLKMEYGLLFLKLGDKKNANLNLRIALEIFEKHNMDKKKLEEILKEI
ncbi:MAG: tetratricopeptide repeat protein, partial [Candidatus Thermoplasmatota archaeon]